ncbi:DUF7343 domain-containing protein [Geoglobus acetivorans]|uniref:Winged helix-turn-helix transcriptional regulator n=1 Tax=Geoglobus acetivorans TaxID=565033 RepID=A0ABZ3H2S1_GEOAI|nr:winged helix-turn-helix transcriptional regulator [Geoglobus acetivorans]
MKKILVILALLLIASTASGAKIQGTVFSWETFEPLKNVIITINTTPQQRIVSEDGSYMFEVPPGVYSIEVYHYNDLTLYANETVVVEQNGTYRIDILAYPLVEELDRNMSEELNLEFNVEDGKTPSNTRYYWTGVALLLALLFTGAYMLRKRRSEEVYEIVSHETLPEDLSEIVEIIRQAGGRITQKELRQKTGYSDAKISLMLADLERRGVVEKVKKGRGNIIFLKD